jgi:hypothetical protein
MNIIAKLKKRQRHAKRRAEARASLSAPQTSRLDGISTLPVELWGMILDYVVVDDLGDSRRQCKDLYDILKRRLVCRECLNPIA